VLWVISGCSDVNHPFSPLHPEIASEPSDFLSPANQASDSVAWDGDVLQVADHHGIVWRVVRVQSGTTYSEFRIERNGVLVSTIVPTYTQDGTVVRTRVEEYEEGGWFEAGADWVISATGRVGGGGGDIRDPVFPERLDASQEECDETRAMSQCSGEFREMQDAAVDAAWASGIAAVLMATPAKPIGVLAAAVAFERTYVAGRRLGSYVRCLMA